MAISNAYKFANNILTNGGFDAADLVGAVGGGDNTPSFQVKRTSSQTISDVTETKIQFNVEDFDSDNAFDSTTNYRFTVPTGEGGKYCIYYAVNVYDYPATIYQYQPILKKNGNIVNESGSWDGTSSSPVGSYGYSYNNQIILTLVATDYLELFVYINTGDSGTGTVSSGSTSPSFFGGYKMIGI